MKFLNPLRLFSVIFAALWTVGRNMGQGGAIDLFDTRIMLTALEQMKPVRTFFLTTFFRASETSQTAYVDIDIHKGKRRLAPFVSPVQQGKVVERLGYTTRSYKPPYIKPKMVTTAADILKREMGTTIYSANDGPAQRAARQIGKDLRTLDEMITRREEWMAAQLLQSGQVHVLGEGIDEIINFGMSADHIITLGGTDVWSNAASTPLEDLRAWRRIIAKDSGINPDTVVMGADAADAFLDHADVQNKLDTRRIDLGLIDPAILATGAIYYGRIKDVGVDLYVYDEWFVDDSTDTEGPLMPAKKVIMGSTQARTARHYGAIQDLDATGAVARFPKSWTEDDPSARFIMLQSAPLVAMHQVDGFVCVQVLA